jgi:hypothetical protein
MKRGVCELMIILAASLSIPDGRQSALRCCAAAAAHLNKATTPREQRDKHRLPAAGLHACDRDALKIRLPILYG